MKLTCSVNQAAALARGVNAPNSTVVLDIDPGTLPPEDREIISLLLKDGHDLTTRSIAREEYRVQPISESVCDNSSGIRLLLIEPTVEGLVAAIAQVRATYALCLAKALHNEIELEGRELLEQEKKTRLRAALIAGDKILFRDESGDGSFNNYAPSISDDHIMVWPPEGGAPVQLPIAADIQPAIAAYHARKQAWLDKKEADSKAAQVANERAAAEASQKRIRITEQLRQAILRFGTEAQKGRLERNLCDIDTEGKRLLADETFAELETLDLPRYSPLSRAEVLAVADAAGYSYNPDDVTFADPKPLTVITDDEFRLLRTIEIALPGCIASIVEHNGFIDGGAAADLYRYSIDVAITVGDIELTRSFALDRQPAAE